MDIKSQVKAHVRASFWLEREVNGQAKFECHMTPALRDYHMNHERDLFPERNPQVVDGQVVIDSCTLPELCEYLATMLRDRAMTYQVWAKEMNEKRYEQSHQA